MVSLRISQPTTWSVRLVRIVGSNSLHYSLYVYLSDLQLGAVLPPRGPL